MIDSGCKRSLSLPDPAEFETLEIADDSVLSVVQLTPSGRISADDLNREVVVVFNHPMVPLAVLEGGNVDGLFSIQPPVSGRYRWHGSRAQAFIPEDGFDPGTEYRVTISAGLKALNEMELEEDYTGSFETPPLEISGISPGTYGSIDYNQTFEISFNYPVAESEIERYIDLQAGNRSIPFRISRPPLNQTGASAFEQARRLADRNRRVRISPVETFSVGVEVRLTVKEGLPPRRGNMGLESDQVRTYNTHPQLAVQVREEADFFQDLWRHAIVFNNSVDASRIANSVSFDPPVERAIEFNNGRMSSVPLRYWNVRPGESYTITVATDLVDIYGNTLTGPNQFRVRIPEYRRSFSGNTGFHTLETESLQQIPFYATAMDSIHVRRVPLSTRNLLSYAESYQMPEVSGGRTTNWDLDQARNQASPVAYIDEDRNPGLYIYQFSGQIENYEGENVDRSVTRIIQKTDIGLSVKEGSSQADIWAHSLSSGRPIAGASVSAYLSGSRKGNCNTNSQGYCSIEAEFTGKPTVFVIENESDRAFVTSMHHSLSMWSLNASYSSDAVAPALIGRIVFDRKLYRPGDEVQFKAFTAIRQDGQLHTEASSLGNLQVSVSDAGGNEVFSDRYSPGRQGGINGSFRIPEDAALGHYNIRLQAENLADISGRNKYYNVRNNIADTFQVEEFRPVRFSVDIENIRNAFKGERLNLSIAGKYLFGAPMQSAPVSYTVRYKPAWVHIERFSGFFFGDDDHGSTYQRIAYNELISGTSELNDSGRFTFPVLMQNPADLQNLPSSDLGRILDIEVEGTVRDQDSTTIRKTESFRMYPSRNLFGISSRGRSVAAGEEINFRLVSVDPDGNDLPATGTIIIERKEWRSILSESPGSSVARRTVLERKEVERNNIALSGDPVSYSFSADQPGNYTITVRNQGEGGYSRMNFYVYGSGYAMWYTADGDAISLVADRSDYHPGETARVLVQSPFEDSLVIVTVEREDVLWQKTVQMDGNAVPVEIPIREEFLPNVYISAVVLRPRIDNALVPASMQDPLQDTARPMYRTGYTKLNVNAENRRIPLNVRTDQQNYGPGDEVLLTIETAPGAEVALSVADRAVLDLVSYRFSDPLAVFYQNWPLGVRSLENRSSIIEQILYSNKGSDPGGKGNDGVRLSGEGGFSDEAEEARRDFRYTAFWDGNIQADSSGRAEVKFSLPDNLSTFRVMAIAAESGRYNASNSEFTVRRDIVLSPVMPAFIRPGDRLKVGAILTNQSGRSDTFNLRMETEGLTSGNMSRSVTLADGQTTEITFEVSADLAAGFGPGSEVKGRIQVSSRSAGSDAVSFAFPVQEYYTREAFRIAGFTDSSNPEGVEEALRMPMRNEMIQDTGTMNVTLSSTVLTSLERGFAYFQSHPYYCTEQRASAFLLAMTAGDLTERFTSEQTNGNVYDFADIENAFFENLDHYQNSDGGFRPWREQQRSHPFLTAYIVFVLQAAQEARSLSGNRYPVDGRMHDRAIDYLIEFIEDPSGYHASYNRESMALIHYVLSRAGRGHASLERFLFDQQNELSLRAKAYLALGTFLRRKGGAGDPDMVGLLEEIRNSMQITTSRISFRDTNRSYQAYSSHGSTLAALIHTFLVIDPDSPLIPDMIRHAAQDSRNLYWWDSHGTGMLSYVMFVYHHKYESRETFSGSMSLAGHDMLRAEFSASDFSTSRSFTFDELWQKTPPGQTSPMTIQSSGGQRLYYSAALQYSPDLSQKIEARDEGLEVYRELMTLEGRSVENIRRGETYLVRLTVINPGPVFDFMLEDPLPSHSMSVNVDFETEGTSYQRFLGERRSEASPWWEHFETVYEYRSDRTLIRRGYLRPGIHEYFYLMRNHLEGSSIQPPARAFLMYEPETFGRTDSRILRVR